jgi:hypothetical protein
MDDNSEACIQHEPFYKPIIDFTLEDDGSIWVLLDADWSSQGSWGKGRVDNANLVEVRRWTPDNVTCFLSYQTNRLLTVLSFTVHGKPSSAIGFGT